MKKLQIVFIALFFALLALPLAGCGEPSTEDYCAQLRLDREKLADMDHRDRFFARGLRRRLEGKLPTRRDDEHK